MQVSASAGGRALASPDADYVCFYCSSAEDHGPIVAVASKMNGGAGRNCRCPKCPQRARYTLPQTRGVKWDQDRAGLTWPGGRPGPWDFFYGGGEGGSKAAEGKAKALQKEWAERPPAGRKAVGAAGLSATGAAAGL